MFLVVINGDKKTPVSLFIEQSICAALENNTLNQTPHTMKDKTRHYLNFMYNVKYPAGSSVGLVLR